MNIHGRLTWTAHPRVQLDHVDWKGKARVLRVHHTANDAPRASWTVAMEKVHLRKLEADAISSGKYKAIPYSYLIFPSGRVYEGRGFEKLGGHTLGHNEDIGVAFAGNHEIRRPTRAAITAHGRLRGKLRDHGAAPGPNQPHRATFATLCPGKYVMSEIRWG